MERIDAHQHFWRYNADDFGWIAPGSALARDRFPDHVLPALATARLDGCIAVQAQHNAAETDWLLALAQEHRWIFGVVGWVDLTAEDIAVRLDRYAGQLLVGIRHIAQDEPDPRYLLRADVIRGVQAILARGLAYDILVRGAAQLDLVPEMVAAMGPGALVLDHGGKPDIAGGEWQCWARSIATIAACPDVVCKLSGLVTEADHGAWRADDIARYLDHLLACFGPDRLMFGSDWPVCLLAADYARVVDLIETFVARACPDHRAAIFGDTARRVYARGRFGESGS
ncbi:amidohydrolase family protein [Sphingomonas sp. GB1N7]|uniref:amidohydrolase family protein n=1 Tax=Parasphingomonas caseinilytica TaxID=3096158 RepID=UPI002FCA1736